MWLVIGYGSTLHSDDGFGPLVAEWIRTLTATSSGGSADLDVTQVEVVSAIQLTPELAEPISRVSGVIFIDASIDRVPGQLICFHLPPARPRTRNGSPACIHHFTPHVLLDTALALYGHAPPAWLYTTGGSNFELGESLSPLVAQTIPRAVALIQERLRGH